MPGHSIFVESRQVKAPWFLRWDDDWFVLQNPDGYVVLKIETASAHHEIDLSLVFIDGNFGIIAPGGKIWFEKNALATEDLKALVNAALQRDPDYRKAMRRRSVISIFLGAAMFVIGGGLFGGYCWFASWAPDPPPDHWMHTIGVGKVINRGLIVLFVVALLGLGLGMIGLRQWLRIRAFNRSERLRTQKNP